MTYEIVITAPDGTPRTLRVELPAAAEDGKLICRVDGRELELDLSAGEHGVLSLLLGGRSFEVRREPGANGEFRMSIGSEVFNAEVRDPRSLRSRRRAGFQEAGPARIIAPMPGKVVRIVAPVGTLVEAGQGVVVIEAMKMQNELKSPKKGTVSKVLVAENAAVNPGDTLAIVE
jgi:biotin carboxyl carrier protein